MDIASLDAILPAYAADCLRVLSKVPGEGYVPLQFNEVQRRLSKRRGTRQLTLKARQQGVTTYYLASHLQRAQFLQGYRIGIIALSREEGATPVSDLLQDMYDSQPGWFLQKMPRLKTRSKEVLEWANGSLIRLFTQGGESIGRGLTFHRLHGTEFGKWKDPATVYAAALPALVPGGELDIESTAHGFGPLWELTQEARFDPDSRWDFGFYPWFLTQEYRLPHVLSLSYTEEEARLAQEYGLEPGQIGWRRDKKRELGRLFPQEYPADPDEAFLATGDSVFPFEVISRLKDRCKEPIKVERDGVVRIWEEPREGVAYCIGADCAEGVPNGDYSAAVIRRANTGMHVGTIMDAPPHPQSRDRRLAPNEFARLLALYGERYNGASVLVERNGPGSGVLAGLADVHRYPNLARNDGATGFRTTTSSKSALKSAFVQALDVGEFTTEDERLPRQMADFIVLETNAVYEKVGARPGAHDDLIMAAMISEAARSQAIASAGRGPAVVRLW